VAGHTGDLDFCYLTTFGRVSGAPHEIEIWFALHHGHVYLLSGGGERSDWVKNLIANPSVSLRLGEETRATTARVVSASDEDALAPSAGGEVPAPTFRGAG
jgi:deazaflavin-dependent oxidoreductase (nitroreductase family)